MGRAVRDEAGGLGTGPGGGATRGGQWVRGARVRARLGGWADAIPVAALPQRFARPRAARR